MTIFAAMTMLGAVVVVFSPETHNSPLPQTIADVERLRDRKQSSKQTTKDSNGDVTRRSETSNAVNVPSSVSASTIVTRF
jgi:hypothetical protein